MVGGRLPFKGSLLKYTFSNYLQFVGQAKKLNSPDEDGSRLKFFPFMFQILRRLSLLSDMGIEPLNLLKPSSKTVSFEQLVIESRICPLSSLVPRYSSSRFGRLKVVGRLPKRRFLLADVEDA